MRYWLIIFLCLLTLIAGFMWRGTQNMIIKDIYMVLSFITSCLSLYFAYQSLKKREKTEKGETDVENNL